MKVIRYLTFSLLTVLFSTLSFAQLDSVWHQGPLAGSLPGGVMVTLNPNTFDPESQAGPRIIEKNLKDPDFGQMMVDVDESLLPEYVYTEDKSVSENPEGVNGQTVLLNKFESIPMTNSIPPDPHIAVGPDHIIVCVNSRFAVYDKEGNELANVSADSWISPVISPGAFDPQIMYDHYEGRWFMLWDWQSSATQSGYFIISYSDDSNPFGTWYLYAMDAKVNGTQNSGTWGDYPQIGYDDQAIFINSRSFDFAIIPNYYYNRIRILNKSQLYSSNGGAVNWIDIWNIRTPGQGTGGQALDIIHPVYSYQQGAGSYFWWANRTGGNYYCVFQILNPLSATPRIRGKIIPTQFYANTPNANQLGGGTPLIESNGSHIKTQPVLRDGKIFFAHSIGNSTNAAYASAKYGIYEISSQTIIEQAEQGAIGYYYIYPTIAVDQDLNIAVTYSRSALTEYIGAYYSTKQATAPAGLEPSRVIQEGLGNYIVTFGLSRNRWGDYLGICVDPADFYNIFMLSEYARATNQWGTYVGEVRMTPYPGAHAFLNPRSLDFGLTEIGTSSNSISLIIANYGSADLEIADIPSSFNDFNLLTSVSFPLTIASYDSILLEFNFSPLTQGNYDVNYPVNSNAQNFSSIHMTGLGYTIFPALDKSIYASSGSQNSGQLLTIDKNTGEGTNIGFSLYNEITGISINPENYQIYGLVAGTSSAEIVRVSAAGDAYNLFNLDIPLMADIAFDTTGILYGITRSGEIYTIDLINHSYAFVVDAIGSYSGIVFHPTSNELWATSRAPAGVNKDAIFKVDLITGDTVIVGHTGLEKITNDIFFDENLQLFGVIGSSTEINDFISIDAGTGVGTIVGSVGLKHILGLAFAETGITNVNQEHNNQMIPSEFVLLQNYPNPFNPSTKIEFSLPVQSEVELNIYNVLGQKVASLFQGQLQSGNHSFTWDATDSQNNKLSSGIYFYEMKANGSNGKDFQSIKKMLLLK